MSDVPGKKVVRGTEVRGGSTPKPTLKLPLTDGTSYTFRNGRSGFCVQIAGDKAALRCDDCGKMVYVYAETGWAAREDDEWDVVGLALPSEHMHLSKTGPRVVDPTRSEFRLPVAVGRRYVNRKGLTVMCNCVVGNIAYLEDHEGRNAGAVNVETGRVWNSDGPPTPHCNDLVGEYWDWDPGQSALVPSEHMHLSKTGPLVVDPNPNWTYRPREHEANERRSNTLCEILQSAREACCKFAADIRANANGEPDDDTGEAIETLHDAARLIGRTAKQLEQCGGVTSECT